MLFGTCIGGKDVLVFLIKYKSKYLSRNAYERDTGLVQIIDNDGFIDVKELEHYLVT